MPLFIIPNLGFPEIMMIMLLALLLFGPKKIPEIGRTLGKGLREFKRSTSGFMDSIQNDINDIENDPPAKASLPKPQPAEKATTAEPKVQEVKEDVQEAEVVIDLESEEKSS